MKFLKSNFDFPEGGVKGFKPREKLTIISVEKTKDNLSKKDDIKFY